jgi:hypothetical protein
MDTKKIICILIISIFFFTLIGHATFACETEEQKKKETENKQETKKCVNKEQSTQKVDVSFSFFDTLLDRYPLLGKIIELLIQFLYNWLSDMTLSAA